MPFFLIEHVTEVVFAIVMGVLLATGALAAIAIARRQRRERYFERIDDLRQRYSPVVEAVLSKKLDYERGKEALKSISGLDRMFVLEQLLLEKKPARGQIVVLRQLCEDLGLVKLWQRQLGGEFDVTSWRDSLLRAEGLFRRFGRLSFLVRAKSAENLGIIQHRASWPLLAKALDDPHPDVQSVAVRSLAAMAEPQSFPVLVERLQKVVLDQSARVSLRTVKSALVSFPLAQAAGLLPSLTHSHRRIRFLATDIIREMVERQAALEEDFVLETTKTFAPSALASSFTVEMAEAFLTQLCFDENPDVRARSAPVIAYLADARSTPVLLTLIEDQEWFVRLHTVRALAKRKFLPQAPIIARRLTDTAWVVREAAARTLVVFGRVGVDQLAEHFLNSSDNYSREQIADEMQRGGLIPMLLAQYASGVSQTGTVPLPAVRVATDPGEPASHGKGSMEARVLRQLAEMGKTSYILVTLMSSSDRNLRKKFLKDFGGHPDPQIKSWVKNLAARETDAELRELAAGLAGPLPAQEGV